MFNFRKQLTLLLKEPLIIFTHNTSKVSLMLPLMLQRLEPTTVLFDPLNMSEHRKLTYVDGSPINFGYQRWVSAPIAIRIDAYDVAVLLITAITAVINFIATLDQRDTSSIKATEFSFIALK